MGNMSFFKTADLCLPTEVFKTLNRTERSLLNLIAEMCVKIHAPNATREFRPINPSEEWLAKRIGVSRIWISKCLRRLEKKKLIHIKRRRKENGKFYVNIYMLAHNFFRLAGRMFQRFFSKDTWKQIIETQIQRIKFLAKKKNSQRKLLRKFQKFIMDYPLENGFMFSFPENLK